MLHTIASAFRDSCASDLSLRLGLAPQPALSALNVPLAGGDVEIRLLGHSHQVLTRAGATQSDQPPRPRILLSEVVACQPGRGGLPAATSQALPGADYHFRSHVAALSPQALARRARRLRDDFSEHPAALVGAFPGWPHALTVVAALERDGELVWRSWHLYPQTAELVVTRSQLRER